MAATIGLILVLALTICSVTGQGNPCPAQCRSCANERVLCAQAGLTSLPDSLPQDSLSMDFTQNEITSLKGLPSLPNTMSLKLAGNKIKTIQGKTFTKVPQLMSLDLSINKIQKIYKQGFKGLDSVMTISLNGNEIKSIGKIFSYTPSLTSLRLSFNEIKEINEDDFENNQMLKMLDLSNNMIERIHPKAFEKLDMLRILLLSNNPLGTLPELTFTTNILTLADFTNCQLTAVPRKMPASLSDFRLGNNRITKILADDFRNITELTLLTLNDNEISNVEHRSFFYNEKLMELWMSRNKMVYIPRGLPTHLEKFHIDNNEVVDFEPMLFKQGSMLKGMSLEANKVQGIHSDALKEVKNIETLNLQQNSISKINTGTFVNLESLKSLTLANNPLKRIEPKAFGNLNNLTDLSLAHIHTDKQESPVVAENFLSSAPNLKVLDLTSSVELTKDLLKVLDENPTPLDGIEKVKLQYNDLESIPDSVKKVFGNAGEIYLDGNVLVCDKRLIWLNKWMKSSNVQFAQQEQPTCHNSGDVNGRSITELQENEFKEVAVEEKPEINNPQSVEPERNNVNEPKNPVDKPDAGAIQPEVKQSRNDPLPDPIKPVIHQSLSGNRQGQQAASKYDNNQRSRYDNGPGGRNIQQPARSNPQPVNRPPPRRNSLGTRVIIKPPKSRPQTPVKKEKPWSQLTKAEKALRKAQRKAKRQRERAARRNSKRDRQRKGERVRRRKRHNKKQCTKDENGVVKCERRNQKRCKVQEDGSVKCRRRKGGKKRKSKGKKKQIAPTQQQ